MISWKAPPFPKSGDERVIQKYAWFPRLIKEEWVWLEYYTVTEVFQETEGTEYYNSTEEKWIKTKVTIWVTTEENVCVSVPQV